MITFLIIWYSIGLVLGILATMGEAKQKYWLQDYYEFKVSDVGAIIFAGLLGPSMIVFAYDEISRVFGGDYVIFRVDKKK
jgi:hypothetical protein